MRRWKRWFLEIQLFQTKSNNTSLKVECSTRLDIQHKVITTYISWVFGMGNKCQGGTIFYKYQYTRWYISSKLCSHLKLGYQIGFVSLSTGTSFRFMEKESQMRKGYSKQHWFMWHFKSFGKIIRQKRFLCIWTT